MMDKQQLSPVEEWLAHFTILPTDAVFQLLQGKVFMGALNVLDPDEILYRLFHKEPERIPLVDKAVVHFMERRLIGIIPSDFSISRWDTVLISVFDSIARLKLEQAQKYLHANYRSAWMWLLHLYQDTSRDPLAHMIRVLALSQTDRGLVPLWHSLCGLKIKVPHHSYADLGILGLTHLPEKDMNDLDPEVFIGFREMANVLLNRLGPEEGRKIWTMKVRAMRARHKHPEEYWDEKFTGYGTAVDWYKALIEAKDMRRETE